MLKAIVFDFGNVIGFFDHRRISRRWAEHSDLPVEAIHAGLIGGRLEDDYESGRISTAEFLRHVRELFRLRCSDEVTAETFADIFWPNLDLCALLPYLKPRYRLLLGSNTCELHSQWFRRQFSATLRHFDDLVLSHEIGARKPRAEFFAHCQRLAGCPAHECLFIDDLPVNVAGAVAWGWHGIVYRGIEELRPQLVEFQVHC